MKKFPLTQFNTQLVKNNINNLFFHEINPNENQRIYDGILVYDSDWQYLYYGWHQWEIMKVTPFHKEEPPFIVKEKENEKQEEYYPVMFSAGFYSDVLSIPDDKINNVKVNLEVKLPQEAQIAPPVMKWKRDISFQMYGLKDDEENWVYRGKYILSPDTNEFVFWNPLWTKEQWNEKELPFSEQLLFPYFKCKETLPCYFRVEPNGTIRMLDFLQLRNKENDPPFEFRYDIEEWMFEESIGLGFHTFLPGDPHRDAILAEGTSIEPDPEIGWFLHPHFVRLGYNKLPFIYIRIPEIEDYFKKEDFKGCPTGDEIKDTDKEWIKEEIDEHGKKTKKEIKKIEEIWQHTLPHIEFLPQESGYGFQKVDKDKYRIIGQIKLIMCAPAIDEEQILEGEDAPVLYTYNVLTKPDENEKGGGEPILERFPQIKLTACLVENNNITTGNYKVKI